MHKKRPKQSSLGAQNRKHLIIPKGIKGKEVQENAQERDSKPGCGRCSFVQWEEKEGDLGGKDKRKVKKKRKIDTEAQNQCYIYEMVCIPMCLEYRDHGKSGQRETRAGC